MLPAESGPDHQDGSPVTAGPGVSSGMGDVGDAGGVVGETGEGKSREPAQPAPRPKGRRFAAELDVCELDDRSRPGSAWAARATELSTSHLVFRSRRMCYPERLLIIAVHLIDDQPVPLFGRVHNCEYIGEGQHRVDIDLLPIPRHSGIEAWVKRQVHRAG